MRFRISDGEVEHYAKAKRDGTKVRWQGRDWRVLGVTVDMMGGVVGVGLQNPDSHRRAQWWIELVEAA